MEHRLWTPSFVGLAFAGFCNSMIFYLLVPAMARYAVDRFGASAVEAGTLASIFFAGALVARLFGGWLVDRFGARGIAIGAALFYVVTTAAYFASPTLAVMLVVRTLNGVGFGLLGSALVSGVMLTLPSGRRAEGAGWFSVGISVAIGLGPWLSLNLASSLGMTAVFVAALVAAVLALVLVLLFRSGLPGRGAHGEGDPPAFDLRTLLDRRALGLGSVVLIGGFAYSSVLAFLDPATRGTPLAPAASWFFLLYALVVLGWRPVSGRIQDRAGEAPLLVPSLVLFAIAMAVAAGSHQGWMLLLGAVLLGFGFGSLTTGAQAAVVSRVPRERTGAALATHFFMLDLGTALGPILLGGLVPSIGFRGVFWVAAACTMLALPLYLLDLRRFRARSGRQGMLRPGCRAWWRCDSRGA